MLERARVAAAAVLWLVMPATALACAYDGVIGDGLSVMHPGSLTVAVALRRAADAGVIDVGATDTFAQRSAQLSDAMLRLHALNSALASAMPQDGATLVFSVAFVESGLWTRFSAANGAIEMTVHTNGPRAGEATLLTGKSVLAKLSIGELSLEHALAAGLIAIQGDTLGQVRRVLVTAFGPGPLRASR